LNILGYKLLGLTGLGLSFLISYLIYLVQVYFVSKFRYEFTFGSGFYRIFIPQLLLSIICFAVVKFSPTPFSYYYGIVFIGVSSLLALKGLDKRIDIKSITSKLLR
jgi:hypothetical protein